MKTLVTLIAVFIMVCFYPAIAPFGSWVLFPWIVATIGIAYLFRKLLTQNMSLAKRALELPKTNALRKRIEAFLAGDTSESYEVVYMYSGRSQKIKKGKVSIIEDKGDKAKVQDTNGKTAIVAKSTLQTLLDI